MSASKFPAVTIVAPAHCCGAVGALEGTKILAAKAPLLPLPNCMTPDRCRCRYKKFPDRREDEQGRRFRFAGARSIWYAGAQRRISRGRRPAD